MADWIDRLKARLAEEQRQENVRHAIKLREDRLIEQRAPTFFRALSETARELVAELNEKLGASMGGVTIDRRTDDSFSLASHGRIETVTLAVRLDLRGQQIIVDTKRTGHRFMVNGETRQAFALEINTSDEVVVRGDKKQLFSDGAEMASALLEAAFTEELFRPY